jgi:hypothetical protein
MTQFDSSPSLCLGVATQNLPTKHQGQSKEKMLNKESLFTKDENV